MEEEEEDIYVLPMFGMFILCTKKSQLEQRGNWDILTDSDEI